MDYEQRRSEQFSERVRFVAAKLRHIADDVEREAEVEPSLYTMQPDHARSAREVIHKVTWGVANLDLDGLVGAAADADRAPGLQAEVDQT